VALGLATGNFRAGAELKLGYYGIWQYFENGAFADDDEDRAGIVRLAARRLLGGEAGGRQVVVIGDTPYDVAAAKANGAMALGVATGPYSLDDLIGSGADIVLPDFSRWEAAIASLVG
jgi:phosphoglycolate phosphatase-like HAD superfamily hydrolase